MILTIFSFQILSFFLIHPPVISTPEHQDSGFLTLLQTFDYPGLEILVDSVWYSVPPAKDSLVVNLGEQMTNMSNGRFKATIHRVIDTGADRFVDKDIFILNTHSFLYGMSQPHIHATSLALSVECRFRSSTNRAAMPTST